MSAPMNMLLDAPTIPVPDWEQQEVGWRELNILAGGNPDFRALTVKAGYVLSIMLQTSMSVEILLSNRALWNFTYLPAIGLLLSSFEILGRCITGNDSAFRPKGDLATGLTHSLHPEVTLVTPSGSYHVSQLEQLRNYVAHGQATALDPPIGDIEIADRLRGALRDGVERWWNNMQAEEEPCNKLALANIARMRHVPLTELWQLLDHHRGTGQEASITYIMNRFSWIPPEGTPLPGQQ